jgi:ubiquinone/menaquinone biosynthesis C-methylase UbiE
MGNQHNITPPLTGTAHKAQWEQGIGHEVDWWKNWIRAQGAAYGEDFANRLDPTQLLQPHIAALLDDVDIRPVRVLDVGAGPLTGLGKMYRGESLDIIAVDPLADAYDALLRDAHILPLIRTTWCHGELLEERFPHNAFDLVYSQNALDHSYDPYRIIVSMIRLAKQGQYVLLEHRQDEAEREQYAGLHQWNFALRDGDFVIWNPSVTINVSEELQNYASIHTEFYPAVDWLITTIQKKSDPPEPEIFEPKSQTHWWPWFRR